jgi:hypothetical protein
LIIQVSFAAVQRGCEKGFFQVPGFLAALWPLDACFTK